MDEEKIDYKTEYLKLRSHLKQAIDEVGILAAGSEFCMKSGNGYTMDVVATIQHLKEIINNKHELIVKYVRQIKGLESKNNG